MTGAGLDFTLPDVDVDRLRGWKNGVTKKLTAGLAGLARRRKVTVDQRRRTVLVAQRGRGAGRRRFHHELSASSRPSSRSARKPATLPFHPHDDPRVIDSTGALDLADLPRAAAGDRRRDHRSGDGDGVRRARMPGDRRRGDGPAHPRRGPGPRRTARETDQEAVREHLPGDQGDQRRTSGPMVSRHVRRTVGTEQRRVRQGPGGGRSPARTATPSARRRRVSRSTSAGSFPVDERQRTECAPHLRGRRRRRAADARAQGRPRGTRRRGEHGRARTPRSTAASSRPSPTPIRRSRGSA